MSSLSSLEGPSWPWPGEEAQGLVWSMKAPSSVRSTVIEAMRAPAINTRNDSGPSSVGGSSVYLIRDEGQQY